MSALPRYRAIPIIPSRVVDATDAYQRRHSWLGFPLAVVYSFGDHQGPSDGADHLALAAVACRPFQGLYEAGHLLNMRHASVMKMAASCTKATWRRLFERAKGILMDRHGIDEREAFDLLRSTPDERVAS